MKWTNCLSVPPDVFPATSMWAQQTDDVEKPAPPNHKLVCCAAIPGNGKFKTSDESRAINGTRRMHGAWRRAGGEDYHTCPNVQSWKEKKTHPALSGQYGAIPQGQSAAWSLLTHWPGLGESQPCSQRQLSNTVIFYTQEITVNSRFSAFYNSLFSTQLQQPTSIFFTHYLTITMPI